MDSMAKQYLWDFRGRLCEIQRREESTLKAAQAELTGKAFNRESIASRYRESILGLDTAIRAIDNASQELCHVKDLLKTPNDPEMDAAIDALDNTYQELCHASSMLKASKDIDKASKDPEADDATAAEIGRIKKRIKRYKSNLADLDTIVDTVDRVRK